MEGGVLSQPLERHYRESFCNLIAVIQTQVLVLGSTIVDLHGVHRHARKAELHMADGDSRLKLHTTRGRVCQMSRRGETAVCREDVFEEKTEGSRNQIMPSSFETCTQIFRGKGDPDCRDLV